MIMRWLRLHKFTRARSAPPVDRICSDTRGQAAVEMALVLPLLLVLLSGIIIAVFIFYSFIQVTNAAREGARAGSVYWATHPINSLTLQNTVRKAIYDDKGTVSTSDDASALGFLTPTGSSFDVTSSDVTVTLLKPDNTAGDQNDPRPGDRLTVRLTYRYTLPIIAVALPMFPQPLVIVRSVMMEIQ